MNRGLRIGIVVAALIIAALIVYGIYHVRTGVTTAPSPVAKSTARASDARQFIAKLQKSPSVDYNAAFAKAQQYQQQGHVADAALLYFFAARGGNGQAAFALATLNDPNYFDPKTSLLSHPAPYQAFKWYTQAQHQGVSAAAQRLQQLHKWAEQAAKSGNDEAQHLLLEWQ